MNRLVALALVLIVVAALILWVASGSGYAVGNDASSANLTYNIIAAVVLLSSLVLGWRGSASEALRYAFVWIALLFALVLGYSYRNDLRPIWNRVAGEVNPALPVQKSNGEVVLRKADNGHFYADVDVNGTSIRMLADTGASAIALSPEDAERVGIDVDQLDFIYSVSTANGQARAAEVKLDEVRVGSIVRNDVRAMVTPGLGSSLLGMSFFSTLSKTAMEGDELLLRD